jgi:hypothetical protein
VAGDVGAVQRLQRRDRFGGQQRQQAVADRRAGVQRRVHRRHRGGAAARHVVLLAGQAVVAGALQRLHPAPALAAHPQRERGAGEAAVGGVEVGRAQAQRWQRATAADGGLDLGEPLGRHLQLQFDFLHGPDRASPARRI